MSKDDVVAWVMAFTAAGRGGASKAEAEDHSELGEDESGDEVDHSALCEYCVFRRSCWIGDCGVR